jgi:drug/metabolite transporter (DMT)-like permease
LLIGSLIALPMAGFQIRKLRVPPLTLLLGVYGLFGFHFLLFLGLRTAPPVEANLINYLWPLGMVVMAPLFLPGLRLKGRHVAAAIIGFLGAGLAIMGRGGEHPVGQFEPGYVFALGSAFVWSSYSLMTRRMRPFGTEAVGSFAAASGVLSLLCHFILEPSVSLTPRDGALIFAMGIGPLGAAFYLWDAAIKSGDPRRIGLLAFATPLLSTCLLLFVSGQPASISILVAAILIIGAAVWGGREARGPSQSG